VPKKRLTEEGVAKLKLPAVGQIDIYDTIMPGLVLRVNYGGAKVWRALHYVRRLDANGRSVTSPTTYKLGRYPHLKLKEAREAAGKFLANPAAALSQRASGSFRTVADSFLKRHVAANGLRSQPETERCLAKYVYPAWQHRPLHEIKRGDVAALLDAIEDRHGARQADVVLAIVRKLFNWHAARTDDYVSPVARGMHRTNGAERKRKRILTNEELRALWRACDESGTFGALAKVLLLTAQRREKVVTMRWTDIDDDTWEIASEAREKANAGSLILPEAVMAIIRAQPRFGANPYVFAASHGGGPFNAFSQRKSELDALLGTMDGAVEAARLEAHGSIADEPGRGPAGHRRARARPRHTGR
jgi:integrase